MPQENQHYVPQIYLERFANSQKQIWVYDKQLKKKFQTHIRNIASEKSFYDNDEVERITGNRSFVEKRLGKLEGHYGSQIQSLIASLESGHFSGIKLRHKLFFSLYMTVQMSRTKESRLEATQMIDTMRRILEQKSAESGLEPPEGTPTIDQIDEYAKDIHTTQLLDGDFIRESAHILAQHIWVIQKAHGKSLFLTGDHPIGKRGHITHPIRSFSGIASQGIEILFPLTPRYTLTLCERKYFSALLPIENSLMPLPCEENMIYCNQFPIRSSTRYVFSREDDFGFVEQLITEEPHWADPHRIRVATNHDEKLGRK